MPGSKSSKRLKRRKSLPKPVKIPEPTLPSSISTEDKPFKLPKKKKTTAKLKQARIKLPRFAKKPKKAKNTYKKGEATLKQKRAKRTGGGNPNLGAMQREKAINTRLAKGYPIEIAVHYSQGFQKYSKLWDKAETDTDRRKIREEAARDTGITLKKYVEKDTQIKDRQFRLYEFYMLHPESRLKTGEESEDTEVFTDTKAQTVEKEVEKAETKAQKASDSSAEATPANLTKVRDDLYLSKDRVYRIARKNNKWKVQKLNKSRNIYEFLFYTSTLKEAAEKIATA